MLHHPAHDVRERLRWVLDPIDVLDLLELLRTVGRLDRELLREIVVKSDMIAEQGVGPERDMVDPDEIGAVLEVLHEAFDRVLRMFLGQRRVRRRFDADDPALRGHRFQDLIGLHPLRVPEPARAGMGNEDRFLAGLDRVEGRLVP